MNYVKFIEQWRCHDYFFYNHTRNRYQSGILSLTSLISSFQMLSDVDKYLVRNHLNITGIFNDEQFYTLFKIQDSVDVDTDLCCNEQARNE